VHYGATKVFLKLSNRLAAAPAMTSRKQRRRERRRAVIVERLAREPQRNKVRPETIERATERLRASPASVSGNAPELARDVRRLFGGRP
jgi:hypothetical protein